MATIGEQIASMEQMEKVVTLCKRRGFVFANSEIYSGLSGFWDYGPLGVELKRNVERFWWDFMVRRRDNVVGLDSSCIGPHAVWKASGHVDAFHDMLVDDKESKERFRVDQLQYQEEGHGEQAEVLSLERVASGAAAEGSFWDALKEKLGYLPNNPNTGKPARFTEPRLFNLMFKQAIGATGEGGQVGYLRAETCQPIFVDFDVIRVGSRQKLPFGIAQIGKAFRNEINPRNFLFRAREFTQMEMEFFVRPDALVELLGGKDVASVPGAGDQPDSLAGTMDWYRYWLEQRRESYRLLGIPDSMLRIREHPPQKLAHYAKAACDIEVRFPFGWGELEGVHHRGDYDLAQHQQHSGKKLEYYDAEAADALVAAGLDREQAKQHATYLPECIETSVGLDRTVLAVLTAAYDEDRQATKKEGQKEDVRIVLRLHPRIAPVACAVLPLSKKLGGAGGRAFALYQELLDAGLGCDFDATGSIGKRYRRQDEIGTPWCITYDFESEEDHAVTIRDRDSLAQDRVPLDAVVETIQQRLRAS